MRLILFTGKGGVGKTSIAAATAARIAASGRDCLLLSSDLAHNLSDLFDRPVGPSPVEVAPRLHALEVNVLAEIRSRWDTLRHDMASILSAFGLEEAVAEEVALFPGIPDLFLLARIHGELEKGDYETLVVDCSPTASTLRLLTLSDTTASKLNGLLALKRGFCQVLRPVARRLGKVGGVIPEDETFGALEDLIRRAGQLGDTLKDAAASTVRLVTTPEKIAVSETRRTFTYLGLFGFPVDAVLVNKIFPDDMQTPYFDEWRTMQAEQLAVIESAFLGARILPIAYLDHEPLGADELAALGRSIYGDVSPEVRLSEGSTARLEKRGTQTCLSLPLPGVEKADLDLGRKGAELLIAAGGHNRVYTLPDNLADRPIASACLEAGRLDLVFDGVDGDG